MKPGDIFKKALLLLILSISLVVAISALGPTKQAPIGPKLTIEGTTITVAIADTNSSREQGLSGRTSLDSSTGMLFVFDQLGGYSFWMKDMRFPLDMIWIDQNWQVVDITHGAEPASYPMLFHPKSPVLYVLEVNAGWAMNHQIHEGSKVTLMP